MRLGLAAMIQTPVACALVGRVSHSWPSLRWLRRPMTHFSHPTRQFDASDPQECSSLKPPTSTVASETTTKQYTIQGATSPTSRSGVVVTTDTNHTLQTDVPLRMGGRNEAPQPVEMLLTALVGCTQATALFVGRQMRPVRLVIERMEFDLKASRDERGALSLPIETSPTVPSRLTRISGRVIVYAENQVIADAAMQTLKEQTEQRCPIANMIVSSGCIMEVDWIDGSRTVDER